MISCPIDPILPQLTTALMRNQSVVLHAPPGAGKTTRVPLALMDALGGKIVMLEPRRIAASSAARWMARTLGEQVGQTVGYSIRFDNRTSSRTRIEVVTEGILTRRIQADPALEGVAVVILDEFHERGLNADLALALCLDIQRNLRDDLKILVMSATLDYGPISALLGGAPVISSEGRAFDVEERYIDTPHDIPLAVKVRDCARKALAETSGDILVFLPGAGEIRSSALELDALFGHSDDISIHTLYGDMPFEEQERAIVPSDKRRIVLATNIAETSLTIEGVRVVIDSGLTRRLEHDSTSGMNRLVTVTTSRASSTQRKGRAGRLGPGVCYRLYGRQIASGMVAFSAPEILLTDLSSLALELAVWGARNPSGLQWLTPPPDPSWQAARELLVGLGAIDDSGAPTPLGKEMSRLPLHPRLARLLVRAKDLGLHHLGSDLSALLSERDIMRHSSSPEREPDIATRVDLLNAWRRGRDIRDDAVLSALRTVQRISGQLTGLIKGIAR